MNLPREDELRALAGEVRADVENMYDSGAISDCGGEQIDFSRLGRLLDMILGPRP